MLSPYLASTEIIDHHTPAVRQLALELAGRDKDPFVVAKRCFEWVRDEIKHSSDYQAQPGDVQGVGSARRGDRVLLRQESPARGTAACERHSRGALLPAVSVSMVPARRSACTG